MIYPKAFLYQGSNEIASMFQLYIQSHTIYGIRVVTNSIHLFTQLQRGRFVSRYRIVPFLKLTCALKLTLSKLLSLAQLKAD